MKREKAMHYTPLPESCRKAREQEQKDHAAFLRWYDGETWNPFDWDSSGDWAKPWADRHGFGLSRFTHLYDRRTV